MILQMQQRQALAKNDTGALLNPFSKFFRIVPIVSGMAGDSGLMGTDRADLVCAAIISVG